MALTQGFQRRIPATGKPSLSPDVPQISFGESQLTYEPLFPELINDFGSGDLGHKHAMTNYLSLFKTGESPLSKISCQSIMALMEMSDKPFGDIATRLRWYRDLEGLTQKEYAEKIGVKRATLNNWESGDYRLSLDGAIVLRKTYGLSLDFMYEGIDDALPMTLRQAWQSRP